MKPDHKAARKQAEFCIDKNYENLAACHLELERLARALTGILAKSSWVTYSKEVKALRNFLGEE